MQFTIEELKKYIYEIQKKYLFKKVYLFGSRAKGTNRNDSDIDLLVEFSNENKSLFLMAKLINDLEDKFRLKVDVISYPIENTLTDINLDINKKVLLYE